MSRGTWVARLVKPPTSAQVMISQFIVGLSPILPYFKYLLEEEEEEEVVSETSGHLPVPLAKRSSSEP